MRVCVLDAWSPELSGSAESHWIAERTIEALQTKLLGAEVVVVAGDLDAAQVTDAMMGPHEGLAYFGHGRERVLYLRLDHTRDPPAPLPLLDAQQIHLLRGRWFHAFACLSGHSLSWDALRAGVSAYLGYDRPITVEFDPEALPAELLALLSELATEATLLLACGERDAKVIRARVRSASDRLCAWLTAVERVEIPWHAHAALSLLAHTLHARMELRGVDVRG